MTVRYYSVRKCDSLTTDDVGMTTATQLAKRALACRFMHLSSTEEVPVKHYLTINDLAERFGVSVRTIWSWLADPRVALPRPIQVGRMNFFDRDKIAEWEKSKEKVSTEAA